MVMTANCIYSGKKPYSSLIYKVELSSRGGHICVDTGPVSTNLNRAFLIGDILELDVRSVAEVLAFADLQGRETR